MDLPPPKTPLSLGAQIAIAALALLAATGGWLIVAFGGFHSRPSRWAEAVFVDGLPALVMALLQFTVAVIGVMALLEQHRLSRGPALAVAMALVLAPPLAWMLLA